MTDRIIKVLEQGRLITRGLHNMGSFKAHLPMDDDDTLSITVDWSDWLGSDTISSVTNEADCVSISGESNTTTTATFTLSSAPGFVQHRVTTAAGNIKELFLTAGSTVARDDYGLWRAA